MLDLSKFQSSGEHTCFHGRHIEPQIYADLNGRNWSLADYEARGGYDALRRILGKPRDGSSAAALTPDQVIAEIKESGLRGRPQSGIIRHRHCASPAQHRADSDRQAP